MNTDDRRRGKDEMNLAVLPIARLGTSDKRTKLEYYGTFVENGTQKDMVWIVDGGSVGLPTEFAERVLVALLYIGAQDNFKNRKMSFTVYRVLKTLNFTVNQRNYNEVKKAIGRLVTITVYSNQAWFDHRKKKRVTTERVFHLIDEAVFHNEDDEDSEETYIVWGKRLWDSIKTGYLKQLDLDFYYSLQNPLTRRLFRFLDKTMAYQDGYQIDIFALQGKLGMAIYEYPSHLKRTLAKAANELVNRGYLADFTFTKSGKFHRIQFLKNVENSFQLPLLDSEITDGEIQSITNDEIQPTTNGTIQSPKSELWDKVRAELHNNEMLTYTTLTRINDGVAVVDAGTNAEWLEARMKRQILRTLKAYDKSIVDVEFI